MSRMLESHPGDMDVVESDLYKGIVSEIGRMEWEQLNEREFLHVAHAYYFFSIQFRENLLVARILFPDDEKLKRLEREECDTDNLSPWPDVAEIGERMNHDEFMRRLLLLSPLPDEECHKFDVCGAGYLAAVDRTEPVVRALSIASYEDGGLEQVFRAMLRAPDFHNPALRAFRHFLVEHIRFDSDPDQGHGALSRHLRPDDRILPLWRGFRDLIVTFTPRLGT